MRTPAEVNAEASKLDHLDDVVPGICMNPECGYTSEVEPDQREGWCEECESQSVRSGIVLAGLI